LRFLGLYRGSDGYYEVNIVKENNEFKVIDIVRAGIVPGEDFNERALEVAWRSNLYWEYINNMLYYPVVAAKGFKINEEMLYWFNHYLAIVGGRALKDALLNLFEYNELISKGVNREARSRWRNAVLFLGIAEQVFWRLILNLIPGLAKFVREFRIYVQESYGKRISEDILYPLCVFVEEFPTADGGDAPISRTGWSTVWEDLVSEAYERYGFKKLYVHFDEEEYEKIAKEIAIKVPYVNTPSNTIAFFEYLSPLFRT